MIRNVSVDGSYDSARVSASEDERGARARRAASARGNLAALLVDGHGGVEAVGRDPLLRREVAAEFAELCEVLGLDPPPESTPPGICARPACGCELTFTGASDRGARTQGLWRMRGFCSRRCEQLVNLRHNEGVT